MSDDIPYEEYTSAFRSCVDGATRVDRHTMLGRCPICGDSKKDKNKKRLYLLRETGTKPTVVKCHNCGFVTTAEKFFRDNFKEYYEEMAKGWNERDISKIKKSLKNGSKYYRNEPVVLSEHDRLVMYNKELETAKVTIKNFFDRCCHHIGNYQPAVDYMRSRHIPDAYIQEMMVMKPEYFDFKKFRFAYFRDYIFIPYIDGRDGRAYYFHSRRFRNHDSGMNSYLMCPYKPDDRDIKFFYNEHRVDREKRIYCVEGTLDAMNIENTIAMNGIHKINDSSIEKFENRYGKDIVWVVDNPLKDKDSYVKTRELLRKNKNVFVWEEAVRQHPVLQEFKDINDIVCHFNQQVLPSSFIDKFVRNNPSCII